MDKCRVIHRLELSTILSTTLSTDSTPLIHRFIHRYFYIRMLQTALIPLSSLLLSTVWKSYPQKLWISGPGCGRFLRTYPQEDGALWIGCGQNTHSMHISCYNLLTLGGGGSGSSLALNLLGDLVYLGEDVAVAIYEVGDLCRGVHNGGMVASAEGLPYLGE